MQIIQGLFSRYCMVLFQMIGKLLMLYVPIPTNIQERQMFKAIKLYIDHSLLLVLLPVNYLNISQHAVS